MHLLLSTALSLFHYVNVPFIEMREQSRQDSEIVSQAYFSEQVEIIEENEDWVKIATTVDHYSGWIRKQGFCNRQEPFLSDSSDQIMAKVKRCAAHLYHVQDTIYGPSLTLPFDSTLEVLESTQRWLKVRLVDGREAYIQRGDVTFDHSFLKRDQMCALSQQFLGLPYTWGGRSSFGYDCSGFVQMLYRQMGIHLPRDAKDQILWKGFTTIPLEDLVPGDLIFFGLDESKIGHVGMYLGKDQFIHATVGENAPYIHVSRLSDPEWKDSGRWKYRAARTLRQDPLRGHQQLLVVTTSDWKEKQGYLQRYQKESHDSEWMPIGSPISVVIGKAGWAWGIGLHPSIYEMPCTKKEGDCKSPAGIFSLGQIFGFASPGEMSHLKMKYLAIDSFTEAVDDPVSRYYNSIVSCEEVKPDWNSSEKMRQVPLYKIGLVIEHNVNHPQSGAGSAIFFHIWRNENSGTAGCTAMSEEHLSAILSWLDKEKHPLVVQLPMPMYDQLQQEWNLPKLENPK